MKRLLKICLLAISSVLPARLFAQFENYKDTTVVQLYGVVMTADSLKAMPGTTVQVKGQNRGTFANDQGVFDIVAMKGDTLIFSYVGYMTHEYRIPMTMTGNQYSIVQLMVQDTTYLPTTIIKARPTREQFEVDFKTMHFNDDALAIAQKATDSRTRRRLMRSLPYSAQENTAQVLTKQAQNMYYTGQTPPQNIFNLAAWNEFIKAWKAGDFKNQNNSDQ
jgi:hypothetical protein